MSSSKRMSFLRREDRLAAWSVGLLLLAVYVASFNGLPTVPDAEVEFQTTSALVRTGRADLGGTPESEALIEARFGVAEGTGARAGRWYSRYGIGQALVGVPLYVIGSALAAALPGYEELHARDSPYGPQRSEYFAHLAVGLRNPLLGAWTAFLLVLTARRLGVGRSAAWWCGMGYGLTTFAWAQARAGLSDVQATFFLVLAFHGIVRLRSHFARLRAPRVGDRLGIGAYLAAAVATRVAVLPAVLALLGIAVFVLHAGKRDLRRAWVAQGVERPPRVFLIGVMAALPLVLGTAALAVWNDLRFGDVFESGYGSGLDLAGFFAGNPLHGAASLFASPGRGLLWMAPALLLLPLALARERIYGDVFWSRATLAIALAVIVPAACMRGWHGAWTYGPRYLLPLLPFAWLGVGLAFESRRGRRAAWRRVGAALFALGLTVQLGGALVDAPTHLDLGLQAAREVWPTPAGVEESEMEERRFDDLQWDWRFAAPWAHLRILRHRVAGLGERFQAEALYLVETSTALEPVHARQRGFAHLAWIDLHRRLGGPLWPAALVCALLVLAEMVLGLESSHGGGGRA
ncbi:MAG TPA: phospholipid carrier-dependent glycosyltransferase [Planctomycetota bacterium]|nr:phospholipid carrier-dependent glycosyltransferase [Planctomycetota bacterium]